MGAVLAKHVPALDYIFSGPALHTFPEFLQSILDGNPELADSILGIISRWNENMPRFRRAIGRDRDIDDYVRPEYQSFVDKFRQSQDALREDAGTAEPNALLSRRREGAGGRSVRIAHSAASTVWAWDTALCLPPRPWNSFSGCSSFRRGAPRSPVRTTSCRVTSHAMYFPR